VRGTSFLGLSRNRERDMPDDNPLPWTERHWDELRAVALESSRKSRVASSFLPLVGPLSADESTVPSNWLLRRPDEAGAATERLEVRAGRTLQLVTLACNIYLRGAEISDPDLDAAKTMVRRASEVLGRLEDAIVFHGLARDADVPRDAETGQIVVQPLIYQVTGGSDLTGLLQVPDTLFQDEANQSKQPNALTALRTAARTLAKVRSVAGVNPHVDALAEDAYRSAEAAAEDRLMTVRLPHPGGRSSPIFEAIVTAIQRLESRGHFGPFAVVLGHALFTAATAPTRSLVLPTDRLAEFLDGRRVLRSGVLPRDRGIVVALGGQPIELVLASDIDVKFLQVTLEPRYVLRVFERLVLRIKELDSVCCLVGAGRLRLTPGYEVRKARS
jgi:uncharacterized linocin/CFP29 family protein